MLKKMKHIKILIVSLISIILSFFIKRRENYLVFGSWCGEFYNDNSKYLSEYILSEYSDKCIFWVGKNKLKSQLPKGIKFLEINSLNSIIKLLKCKYMFFTQMHRPDICKYNVYRGAILCLLDHGIPIKKWAMDDPNYVGELEYKNFSFLKKLIVNLEGENKRYDYFIISSDKGKEIYKSALLYRMNKKSKILNTGTPRNDFLINISNQDKQLLKEKLSSTYNFDKERTVISYLPTYRRKSRKIESFFNRNQEDSLKINKILEKYNAVLLEKNHFVANQYLENQQKNNLKNIIKIDQDIDFQELLIATDIQIADYSGGFVDYVLLNRPIIHYLYDFEEYKNNDSGLYYDIKEFSAGKVVTNFIDLIEELENILKGDDFYSFEREKIKKSILFYEKGIASKRICEYIFNKK